MNFALLKYGGRVCFLKSVFFKQCRNASVKDRILSMLKHTKSCHMDFIILCLMSAKYTYHHIKFLLLG